MQDAKSWLKERAAQHLPSNARGYKFRTWLGTAVHNMLGGISYLKPAEGTVVDQDDNFTLIKEKGALFAIFSTDLANPKPAIGDKVVATFYQLRDFQGLSSDGSDDPAEQLSSGFSSRTIALTGAKTNFPYTWPDRYTSRSVTVTRNWGSIQNPYLQDLIKQLEGIKVDSCRTIADVLVCAKATNLAVTDPVEEKSCDPDRFLWPAISMDVATAKFTGSVAIRYDRAADAYEVDFLSRDGELETHDNIYFDGIGELLIRKVDEGTWSQVKILTIKAAAKKRAVV